MGPEPQMSTQSSLDFGRERALSKRPWAFGSAWWAWNQFAEMREEGIKLVVPTGLHSTYSENIRHHLISFESFIGDVRLLALGGI